MSEREDPDVPLNDSIVQRLQRFGTYGRLKQLALRTVRCVHHHAPNCQLLCGRGSADSCSVVGVPRLSSLICCLPLASLMAYSASPGFPLMCWHAVLLATSLPAR